MRKTDHRTASRLGLLALGLTASVVAISAALAQSQPALTFPGPAQPAATVQPQMAAPIPAAPMPAPPPGGMLTAPSADDAATRMSLQNAGSYLGTMQQTATQQLGAMSTGAVPNPSAGVVPQADLGTAPIANTKDLDQLAAVQRNIQILDAKVKEAELAVKLWGVVFNNEHAKAWREREQKEADEARKRADELAKQKLAAERSRRPSGEAPLPVVYEVVGSRATLLVPGQGEVAVRAGETLSNGLKILSVSAQGVVVDRIGERVPLAFGTMVPTVPVQVSPQGQ